MPRHTERRDLPYTPEQLFDLVADVGRYQEFLPWVAAVRIRSDSETLMIADLVVGFKSTNIVCSNYQSNNQPALLITVQLQSTGLAKSYDPSKLLMSSSRALRMRCWP